MEPRRIVKPASGPVATTTTVVSPMRTSSNTRRPRFLALLLLAVLTPVARGFQAVLPRTLLATTSTTQKQQQQLQCPPPQKQLHPSLSTTTTLSMFMGSEGGILGIGTPELATIMLVGYFVLGPSDLYKIVKEVGKFIQNIRTMSTDLTTSFENNMESQLQLEELRKAQRELNDAFSFRRSINVDDQADAFATKPATYQDDTTPAVETTATVGTEVSGVTAAPKKIRRRVKKVVNEKDAAVGAVPDLEMPSSATAVSTTPKTTTKSSTISDEEAALIDQEFEKYTSMGRGDTDRATTSSIDSWYGAGPAPASAKATAAATAAEQTRFQQQLSGGWNEQIVEKTPQLEPLAAVMNKIALLEKEKMAAQKLLDEEFARRKELEQEYYKQQRQLLEEAALQVQQSAFGLDSSLSNKA